MKLVPASTHVHPRDVLLGAQAAGSSLPVCDHYCGIEARMLKSLQLQKELAEEFGTCVFDVTLDCEDGAPVGGETEHAELVAKIASNSVLASVNNAYSAIKKIANTNTNTNTTAQKLARVAVRVHAPDHAAFESDIDIIVGQASHALCHVMIPKVESVADIDRAVKLIDAAQKKSKVVSTHLRDKLQNKGKLPLPLPLHVLIESPTAVHRAFEIAAHPRVQSLSFGLMDFVSSHGGAIPASAMGLQGQFAHPLVVHAKLAIASACHAHGKVPSHCVVTEFSDADAIKNAALQAANTLGFTRMWSIHPSQIRPILAAFAPDAKDIDLATHIIAAGVDADWAPISYKGTLHDRASYRYYWQVLERAHQTGRVTDTSVAHFFND
jgi:citrate lyase subunit beta / citryl-CoA lyase